MVLAPVTVRSYLTLSVCPVLLVVVINHED
jgi:hypothetical protein